MFSYLQFLEMFQQKKMLDSKSITSWLVGVQECKRRGREGERGCVNNVLVPLKTFHTLFYSSEEHFLLDNFTADIGQKPLFGTTQQ